VVDWEGRAKASMIFSSIRGPGNVRILYRAIPSLEHCNLMSIGGGVE
jgi:hypothetical protein